MPDSIGSTLPRTVVREDHRLEKQASGAAKELMELRWHWTLDETNPKRVPVGVYAAEVGLHHSAISRDVRAYALVRDDIVASPTEARERVGMSVETEAAATAVAKARKQKLTTVRQSRQTEVKRVREVARERAEKHGTTVEEEAEKVADWIVKSEKATAKETKARAERHGLRWVEAENKIARIYKLYVELFNISVDWDDEETELLTHSMENVKALQGLIDLKWAGTADIDWDAELAKLDEGLAA